MSELYDDYRLNCASGATAACPAVFPNRCLAAVKQSPGSKAMQDEAMLTS